MFFGTSLVLHDLRKLVICYLASLELIQQLKLLVFILLFKIFIPHRGRRREAKILICHVLFVIKVGQRERLGFLCFLEVVVIVRVFLIIFAKVRRVVRQLHRGRSSLENRLRPLFRWNLLDLVNFLRDRLGRLWLKAVFLELIRAKAVL